MSKYIVKNCPSVSTSSENEPLCYECLNNNPSEPWRCMDRDCLIKQLIEKCKNIECPCEFNGADCWECKTAGQKTLAEQILQLFEIEECE